MRCFRAKREDVTRLLETGLNYSEALLQAIEEADAPRVVEDSLNAGMICVDSGNLYGLSRQHLLGAEEV